VINKNKWLRLINLRIINRSLWFAEPVAAIEDYVTMLVDMGFTRERATLALQRANNDLETATTILLQETDNPGSR
jgi:uncharacterized UBP type Zn finger protein